MPDHLHTRLEGNRFDYAPVTLAFGELVIRLRRYFGENSPLPVALAKAALPTIESMWHAPVPAPLVIRHEGMHVTIAPDFLLRAKEQLAAIRA
ncbi:MAG: hypothetical protein WEG40_12810 [Candidatus Rokuibacteriota bacterium]